MCDSIILCDSMACVFWRIYICMCINLQIWMRINMCICMSICMSINIYICWCINIYIWVCLCTCRFRLRQNGTRKGGLSWEIAKERSALCNDMYIGLFWHVYRSLLTQETHSRSLQREREFSSERLEREWLSWVKRDLYTCQKRPIYVSKETNIHVKWERPSSLLSALCNSLCSRAVCTLPLYTKTREHAGSLSAENRD